MEEKSFLIDRLEVGEYRSNAYLVYPRGEDRALLIDAGGGENNILRALSKQGASLAGIFLTHGHFDHVLAAGAIQESTGVDIYIHKDDAGMLKSPEACLCPERIASKGFMPMSPKLLGSDLPFARMSVLHTPGHTQGSVCYYFEEEGVLFTGDTLFAAGVGRTDMPGGDMSRLAESLRMLFKLPEEVEIYPGHGEPSTIGKEKGRYAL